MTRRIRIAAAVVVSAVVLVGPFAAIASAEPESPSPETPMATICVLNTGICIV